MSNFDFLDQTDFLRFPACKALYEFAMLAEDAYYADHEKCALKVRFVLEQFCILVSEIKGVNYPDERTPFTFGKYWNRQNRIEFIQAIGDRNVTLVRQANAISRSFLQSDCPRREDIYPEMLQKVYLLLLWLYRELGLKTGLQEADYSVEKIPKGKIMQTTEPEIIHSPRRLLANLKQFFPECNTEKSCLVEYVQDKYIVSGPAGDRIETLAIPEMMEYTEAQASMLYAQLSEIKKEFDLKTREFILHSSAGEGKIQALEKQLQEAEKAQSRQSGEIRRQIRKTEREKAEIEETYRRRFAELGAQYDELKDRYDEIRPLKEKYAEIQARMKQMLLQRARLQTGFEKKQEELIREVQEIRERLADAQNNIASLRVPTDEENVLISRLEAELSEKEKNLEQGKGKAVEAYRNAQAASANVIEQYKDRGSKMETMMTRIMEENMRFKERLAELDHVEETKGYLQVVREGIAQINESNAIYRDNADERELREYLLQVKEHYEDQLDELNERLDKSEKELEWEKRRYEDLLNSLDELGRAGKVPEQESDEQEFEKKVDKPEDEPDKPEDEPVKTGVPMQSSVSAKRRYRKVKPALVIGIVVAVLSFLIGMLVVPGMYHSIFGGQPTAIEGQETIGLSGTAQEPGQ